jgi:hypothetical protein
MRAMCKGEQLDVRRPDFLPPINPRTYSELRMKNDYSVGFDVTASLYIGYCVGGQQTSDSPTFAWIDVAPKMQANKP